MQGRVTWFGRGFLATLLGAWLGASVGVVLGVLPFRYWPLDFAWGGECRINGKVVSCDQPLFQFVDVLFNAVIAVTLLIVGLMAGVMLGTMLGSWVALRLRGHDHRDLTVTVLVILTPAWLCAMWALAALKFPLTAPGVALLAVLFKLIGHARDAHVTVEPGTYGLGLAAVACLVGPPALAARALARWVRRRPAPATPA